MLARIFGSIRYMSYLNNRRQFIQRAGSASLAFTILKAGSARTYAANEKLNIASVGAGGQAAGDIRNLSSENIIGLADVDWQRAAGSFRKYSKAKQFKDYRKMFDEMGSGIDAVIVGTPDHHHFHATLAAIRMGKAVYTEKPLTHSVWEARELTKAARKAGVVTQMGNQAQASEETRVVQEFVMDNAAGQIREAHIWTDRPSKGLFGEYWPQGIGKPAEIEKVPDTLDWNLWLGPAPERGYNSVYCPRTWRGWWDFGTGALGDIACHFFDPVFRALKLGAPSSVEATSSRANDQSFPLASMITYLFPKRGDMAPLKLVWYDGGLRPARHRMVDEGAVMGTNGLMLVGDDGVLLSDWKHWRLYPEKRGQEYGRPPKKLKRSPGHHQEFIIAAKGGVKAGSNFDWAGPLTETVLLGNVALRAELREDLTKKKLLWNGKKMQFTNHPEANAFLRREYRTGW